ncbi:MAG: Holliday junction resolvase-like protein [Candidatus Aenigmatarchaeota archaeon]
MIEYIFLLLLVIIVFLSLKFYSLKKEIEFLKKGQREILFEFSTIVRDRISEKIKSVSIPKSLKSMLIEAVSKDVIEQFSVFTEKFREEGLNARDAIHLGEPIDFLVFDGWRNNDLKRIVFIEVKSGDAKLTETQKKIKEIVEKNKDKIEWKTLEFGEEKIVDESKIRELIENSISDVELKDRILKEVKDEELRKIVEEFLEKQKKMPREERLK